MKKKRRKEEQKMISKHVSTLNSKMQIGLTWSVTYTYFD